MQFIKPTDGLITSFFSPQRKNPVTGILRPHTGADIGWYGKDDRVVAMASGKIVIPRYSNTAGNYIWIEHGNGYTSVYSHLKSISVKNGQHVKQGQLIGIKGTTGNSTGIHLHLELIKHHTFSNDWSKKVNPLIHFVDNTTKQWQGWLKELGYYKGSVDGIYGDTTIKAVFDYQKKNKISADGVCGRSTYNHIKNVHSKLDKSPTPSFPPPTINIKEDKIMLNETGRKEARLLIKRAVSEGVFDASFHTDSKINKYTDGELVSYVIAYVSRKVK